MSKDIKYVRYFFTFFIIGLTLIFGTSIAWNTYQESRSVYEYARVEATASYNKDLLYRRWAAQHGGVYVPITAKTPPNPYLSHVPERDISTPSGKKLTLVNPAYMTRQVLEIGAEQYGVIGHITSMKPIRPQNSADEWESHALQLFETGIKEYHSIEKLKGKEYLRFVRPMIVEQSCLKCHAGQGYKLGGIRGGISVSVPMDKFNTIKTMHIRNLVATHSIVYLLILIFTIWGYRRLILEMKNKNQVQLKVLKNEADLQKQNYEYMMLNEEYRSQNEQLQLALEKAEESDRLKASFLQNISHEIRTPLNAIVGFSSLLEKPELPSYKKQHFTNIIINSSSQLLSIVTDILTISSLETKQAKLNIRQHNINQIIREIYFSFEAQAKTQNIAFEMELALDDMYASMPTDKAKLSQIISNLVSNAFKFTTEGSVRMGYRSNNKHLEFYVKDSGIGIEQNLKGKIFEHFRQADLSLNRKYGGTGLGLSISKAFVELLGGHIWVESELEKGSAFYFTLPFKTPTNE